MNIYPNLCHLPTVQQLVLSTQNLANSISTAVSNIHVGLGLLTECSEHSDLRNSKKFLMVELFHISHKGASDVAESAIQLKFVLPMLYWSRTLRQDIL